MSQLVQPHFSETLRTFSGVAADEQCFDEPADAILQKKEVQNERRLKKSSASWNFVKQTILSVRDKSDTEVIVALRELLHYAQEFAGGDCLEEVIQSAALLLLDTFQESEDNGLVSDRQRQLLRTTFGSFPPDLPNRAHSLVRKIFSWLPPETRDLLLEQKNSIEDQFPESAEFTRKLKVGGFVPFVDDEIEVCSEDELFVKDQARLDMSYKTPVLQNGVSRKPKNRYNSSWLREQVQTVLADNSALGLSVEEIVNVVTPMLDSHRTDKELEGEMFEFFGAEFLGVIHNILDHRKELVKAINAEALSTGDAFPDVPALKNQPTKPTYGCQVTVQSEQEKALMKKIQKEEKRIGRDRMKNTKDQEDEVQLNVEFLRRQKHAELNAELKTVKEAPLLPRRPQVYVERYPNVYDSFAEAKKSAAFIAGTKLALPTDCKVKSTGKYEEVSIPLSKPPPPNVGNKLVKVADLDEVCRIGFKGVETLNRIQSIVFDTVYNTNENLLICAPTGAGKTNVAMLAILHEVKQHVDGKGLGSNFKVVYVAPMKALAAEMVRNFGKKLEPLGVVVRELTGDMQLSKAEIMKTHMLVTTPEKWDVVTRKSTGDIALNQIVKLLILDEVHLLHGDRGPVLEALVARTLRQVESSQRMIRIVGLSATLPNYEDVAHFLRVNPRMGLFYFDNRFRPVPLGQTFIGVKATSNLQQMTDMDEVCFDRVFSVVQKGFQVMVFVHSRNSTVKTARALRELAQQQGKLPKFQVVQSVQYVNAEKQMMHSRNSAIKDLFPYGFSIHHAGMLRCDRNLVEKLFSEGMINVLVCTSTLAWGVNLPAHAVIIKGTDIYDSKHGSFVDLDILDVMQIFGRAGRPQFDKEGHGTIITTHAKLNKYLSLLTCQFPIESNFHQNLMDNLNAEISLGTVSTVSEAVEWLSYTYLFVRMRRNPLVYGIKCTSLLEDPTLCQYRRDLVISAAKTLDKARMIRFDAKSESLDSTNLGRTASHFYIKHATVEHFNDLLERKCLTEGDILAAVSKAQEFDQLQVREDELPELDLLLDVSCKLSVAGGSENSFGKVNILLQNFISRGPVESFSLISDQAYIVQNATRILRALFDMVLRAGGAIMAGRILTLCKAVERQVWSFESPLKQFPDIGYHVLKHIEEKDIRVDYIKDMGAKDIGMMVHNPKVGTQVELCARQIPQLVVVPRIQPITRTVIKVQLDITADFRWSDRVHKGAEAFWIWVEDPNSDEIYHYEYFVLTKMQAVRQETQNLVFTIPVTEPLPPQYLVRVDSDHWLGSEQTIPLTFHHLILPERHPPHTELLDLQPLPVGALNNVMYEVLYSFSHFNPIQTQIFHTLYHTDYNVLLGAPTGSGKTIAAEIAMFRIFNVNPSSKVVYIAPLKALVRERIKDWKVRLEEKLDKKVAELTGDVTPDFRVITNAHVIVTTPEKWDGISRSWHTRGYVKDVSLIIIDEIHLLGEGRGPVLEVIVSRANYISSYTNRKVRIIGLSTALANARDLADWLGIGEVGLYNFKPAVRPVPLEVHVAGFPGKHYCPRMALMNKPTYRAVQQHSPEKPVLIFVSSRRQTRLTALDLIAFLAAEDNPRQWLHMPDDKMDSVIQGVNDQNLKLALAFGIGLHHAGLQEKDRRIVEELFVNQKIQVLIATSTLAWGVNFPAHLVVVKGTEYYDAKVQRYVDFPITDVLQMIGRAGRPQFDDQGVAVVLVHDLKKKFYNKFLYEPFPVESSLLDVLADHVNAEVVAGTIRSTQDCLDYMTWTYFYRRLLQNPSYYGLENTEPKQMNAYLSNLVTKALRTLQDSSCLEVDTDDRTLISTALGKIASFYYMSHESIRLLYETLQVDSSVEKILRALTQVKEYAELPVRHNEDLINGDLAKSCPVAVDSSTFNSPYTKAHLLFQAHFSRLQLPCSDYKTDTKSVLDQAIRLLQAIIDIVGNQGWLCPALSGIILLQMIIQARWHTDNTLLTLPHIDEAAVVCFKSISVDSLPEAVQLCNESPKALEKALHEKLQERQLHQVMDTLRQLPNQRVRLYIEEISVAEKQDWTPIKLECIRGPVPDDHWVPVRSSGEYVLQAEVSQQHGRGKGGSFRALAPCFPKPKDEGWFLVLGHAQRKELIALKRVGSLRSNSKQHLTFRAPQEVGRVVYTFYLMSDSYLGLDQQYTVCLDVQEAGSKAYN
ncbi:activating signal cointegrator 1 complex subunit 3 [Ixodes scapularis]|uniref:activating signal cointegrator 1 complex subunit 3 n=1 Tax=Ixodes scapularis TaxID=6945 RepID=UPI001C393565|nr:activating signal cointegrator 1 complex subunit 3 [Ixodes scapularis]